TGSPVDESWVNWIPETVNVRSAAMFWTTMRPESSNRNALSLTIVNERSSTTNPVATGVRSRITSPSSAASTADWMLGKPPGPTTRTLPRAAPARPATSRSDRSRDILRSEGIEWGDRVAPEHTRMRGARGPLQRSARSRGTGISSASQAPLAPSRASSPRSYHTSSEDQAFVEDDLYSMRRYEGTPVPGNSDRYSGTRGSSPGGGSPWSRS